jgi:hypothetical protein
VKEGLSVRVSRRGGEGEDNEGEEDRCTLHMYI